MNASDRVDSAPDAGPPRTPWFLRSRARLALALFLGLAVPFVALAATALLAARRSLEEEAIARNGVAARLGAATISAHVRGLVHYVEAFAGRRELALDSGSHGAECVDVLRQLVRGEPELDRAFLADLSGVEVVDWPAAPDVRGRSFAHRDWFRGASTTGRSYVSEVYLRHADPQRLIVAVATPLRTGDGPVTGYLVAHHPIESFAARLVALAPSAHGSLSLVDSAGHLLDPRLPDSTVPRRIEAAAPALLATGDHVVADPLTGEESLASVARADPPGWSVAALQPTAVVFAPARTNTLLVIACAAVCFALAAWAGLVAAGAVRRHHDELAAASTTSRRTLHD